MLARFVLFGLGFFVFGCGGDSTQEVAVPTPAVEAAPAADAEEQAGSDTLGADALANLAKADAKDGAEDKVVSKCALCALHMDGSPEHAVSAGEYSLHMCSADCKAYFEEDVSGSLAKLADVVN
ncbi:MAG: hypothetical protein VX519_03500 [Myxococcota bacterium]|nr:hypothetical protein [Myxococcota bacterium]